VIRHYHETTSWNESVDCSVHESLDACELVVDSNPECLEDSSGWVTCSTPRSRRRLGNAYCEFGCVVEWSLSDDCRRDSAGSALFTVPPEN
jgi:hypothetical protein